MAIGDYDYPGDCETGDGGYNAHEVSDAYRCDMCVDYIYAVPFVDLYDAFLGDYVQHLRAGDRGPRHFWELVKFYERVKYVPSNHPAVTGAPDWPPDPRKVPHGRG